MILRLGYLGDETRDLQDFHVVLAAQQAAIDARLFILEHEVRFTFVEHIDTIASWLSYVAEHEPRAIIPAELVARARELLPPGTAGAVRMSCESYAARLRRAGGPDQDETSATAVQGRGAQDAESSHRSHSRRSRGCHQPIA